MRQRRGRFRRVARGLLAGLAGVFALVGAVVGGLLWWSLPGSQQQLRIAGLAAPVRTTLDVDGIPRIRAGSARDAATALGFMHARDRMFQMDLGRRAASGRLSELAGSATLRLDRTMRVLGLERRATADLAGLTPETRGLLDAYALGVNAWITERGRFAALEFILLGAPAPWTPVDSLLWAKTMGLYLSGNWRTEVARAAAPRSQPLWPSQDTTPRPDASVARSRLAALVPQFPEPFTQPDSASNEWAVDGRHTVSGAPLLAGDPHLGFSMPNIWYLARIETPDGVLAGATAPGVPFLVIGHNGRIAWTFTTTGADTQDVFVETVLPDGTYQTPDGPRPFETREERIAVRGQPDQVQVVRETRHGPVLSDLDDPAGPVLAVAMANLAPSDTAANGLIALNAATDAQVAGEAAALITAPVQNLLVADRVRIAQFTTGRIPLRRAGDGSAPVDGADGAHDWTGFAQGRTLPWVVSPESGRLVNANERIAPPDFPVFLGRDWFGDWRAQRIRAVLKTTDRHDAAGFAALQVDAVSSFAQAILPVLRTVSPADAPSRQALALLADWDGGMRMDQPQPLIFNAWMRRFEAAALAARGVSDAVAGQASDVVALLLAPSETGSCGGACGPVLSKALADAMADLATHHGADSALWRWGAVHQAVFSHPLLGRLPWVGALTTWRIDQPGDDTTVFRGGMRGNDWSSVHGAGFRGVYDLANLDRSRFAATPGQSGHPFRYAAASLMQRWRDGTNLLLGPEPALVNETVELSP